MGLGPRAHVTRNLLARLEGLGTRDPGVSPGLDMGFLGLWASLAALSCHAVLLAESDLGGPGRPQLAGAIVGLVCSGSHGEGNVQVPSRAWSPGPPGRVGRRPLHWAGHAHAQWRLCIASQQVCSVVEGAAPTLLLSLGLLICRMRSGLIVLALFPAGLLGVSRCMGCR